MNRILIVDDEPNVLAAFEEMLGAEGYEVLTADQADTALSCLASKHPDLVILDICMPVMNGLDALQAIKQQNPRLPVIVMTGQGTMRTAIEATKRGAFEYHVKPFEPEEMLQTIQRALEGARLMQRRVAMASEAPISAGDAIVGRSAEMQQVYKTIGRVAPTDATVLIRGESGTGKELVMRAVYQHSLRAASPLQVLNCTAIPEGLLESELFGHERGAFTNAISRRIGKFEKADGGTLFLDEIGDIPLATQAKILRVLQEKEFQRVGGNETICTDVRVLAATNRDLEEAIRRGNFREDLYHRLDVVTIRLPPLRARREDIPVLVDYFLDRLSRELKIDRPLMSDEALRVLSTYDWPGNVRELEHCVQRTLILTRGHPIQPADLCLGRRGATPDSSQDSTSSLGPLAAFVKDYLSGYHGERAHATFLEAAEKLLVHEALRRTGGNQSQAARLLGMTRPTLHAKIQKLGLRSAADDDNPWE